MIGSPDKSLTTELTGELEHALAAEQECLASLKGCLAQIADVVTLLQTHEGGIVFTGVGKSGLLARRVASSFLSVGYHCHFMHAYEAMHGDLGVIREGDLLFALSHSGETPEVIDVVEQVTRRGCQVVAVTSAGESRLARSASLAVRYSASNAIDLDSLPTRSLTAMTVIFNLILIGLCGSQNEATKQLAANHPNGTLGLKLFRTVNEFMKTDVPVVDPDGSLTDVLLAIDEGRYGMCFVSSGPSPLGIITSGDIRRALKSSDVQTLQAEALVNPSPRTVDRSTSAFDARVQMRNHNLAFMVVADNDALVGIVRAMDIV